MELSNYNNLPDMEEDSQVTLNAEITFPLAGKTIEVIFSDDAPLTVKELDLMEDYLANIPIKEFPSFTLNVRGRKKLQ